MTLARLLEAWLPRQRWFAAGSSAVAAVRAREVARLVDLPDRRLDLVIADVEAADLSAHYLVPVSRHRVAQSAVPVIGELDGWVLQDGALDASCNGALIDLVTSSATVGEVSAHRVDALPDLTGPGRALGVEQSNTSLVYADAVVLKLFRRLTASPNPDLEVTKALGELGSVHVAPALGWIEGAGFTLAILQPFLRDGAEAWALATECVRDLERDPATADFSKQAHELGVVTAGLHADLRRAFGSTRQDASALRGLAALLSRRLAAALAAVPELTRLGPAVAAAYQRLAQLDRPHTVQRIHGDLHLGQLLRTGERWVVLDFEGEPARPVAERIQPMSPIRDIAGMLRSFDYAAKHHPGPVPVAPALAAASASWTQASRAAFCEGYATEAGHDPRDEPVLLRALELDKAVYEVRYEADHRPHWLHIPLEGVERLVA